MDILQSFQEKLQSQGDTDNHEELERLKQMLESPLFQQLLVIQYSVKDLNTKLKNTSPENVRDFEFAPTGELLFPEDGHSGLVGMDRVSNSQNADFGTDTVNADRVQDLSSDMHTVNESLYANSVPYETVPLVELDFPDDNHDQIIKALSDSNYRDNEEFVKGIEVLAQGREVETVKLIKPDQGGLGFSVVGLKSDNRGELGIFIQEIQPGGVSGR